MLKDKVNAIMPPLFVTVAVALICVGIKNPSILESPVISGVITACISSASALTNTNTSNSGSSDNYNYGSSMPEPTEDYDDFPRRR